MTHSIEKWGWGGRGTSKAKQETWPLTSTHWLLVSTGAQHGIQSGVTRGSAFPRITSNLDFHAKFLIF